MDEKLDLIKVEEATSDEQTEQRSQLEEQQFQKRTAAENYQHTQERMRERNERRIERFETKTTKLEQRIAVLNSETKIQHGELEKLRERSSWKKLLGLLVIVFAGGGAVMVKCFDKSDSALYCGHSGNAWFLFGLMLIGISVLLNAFLALKK